MTAWRRPLVLPMLVLLVFAAATIGRRGQWPVNIDEALHLGNTDLLADSLHRLDFRQFAGRFLHEQGTIAPLGPLLAAPLIALGMPDVSASLLVLAGCAAVVLVATYLLAKDVAPASANVVPLLLVASSAFVVFTGTFVLAMPTAASFAVAALALVRSGGWQRMLWSVVAGGAVGAAVLSRAVSISLAPALVLAFLIAYRRAIFRVPARALQNGALFVVAATVVAGPWYLINARPVFEYLTGFGYGADVETYRRYSAHEVGFYLLRPRQLLDDLGVLAGVGLIAVGVLAWRQRRTEPGDVGDRTALLFVGLWVVLGLTVLTTSSNEGFGFTVPLLAPALIVAAALIVRGRRVSVLPAAIVAVLALTVSLARPEVPINPDDGPQRVASALGLESGLAQYYAISGYDGGDERAWAATVEGVAAAAARVPLTVLEAQGVWLNTSALRRASVLDRGQALPIMDQPSRQCDTEVTCAASLRRGVLYVLIQGPRFAPAPPPSVFASAVRQRCRQEQVYGDGRAITFRC